MVRDDAVSWPRAAHVMFRRLGAFAGSALLIIGLMLLPGESPFGTGAAFANSPPTIDTPAADGAISEILETATGGRTIVQVVAIDEDGDDLHYRVVDPASDATAGEDGALFSIDVDGNLRFKEAKDYETQKSINSDDLYDVTVEVDDGYGGITRRLIVVEVTDVDEAAYFVVVSFTTATLDALYEFTIQAVDPEGASVTYSDGLRFGPDSTWLTLVDNGNGTATLSGTPSSAEGVVAGDSYVISVSAEDESRKIGLYMFPLSVEAASNNRPTADGLSLNSVENTEREVELEGADSDGSVDLGPGPMEEMTGRHGCQW